MEREIIRYSNIHGVAFTDSDIPSAFPPHWHNEAEFIFIKKKGCIIAIDGTSYSPEPGDVLLIWPRELHEIRHVPQQGMVFIQFSSAIIEGNSDLAAALHFLSECHIIRKRDNAELTAKFEEYLYRIRDIQAQNMYFAETRSKLAVYELLLEAGEYILREYRHSLGDVRFSDRLWEYIRYACSYINEHSSEDITQALVARKTGLSQYYFSKLFNEYTKMSFPSYLSCIRVQKAINLLENKTLSVTDCAYEAGFQSTTTFNKVFHEITGCSPREYRKMHSLRNQF